MSPEKEETVQELLETINWMLKSFALPVLGITGILLNLGAFGLVLISKRSDCFHIFAMMLPLSNILPILAIMFLYDG